MILSKELNKTIYLTVLENIEINELMKMLRAVPLQVYLSLIGKTEPPSDCSIVGIYFGQLVKKVLKKTAKPDISNGKKMLLPQAWKEERKWWCY